MLFLMSLYHFAPLLLDRRPAQKNEAGRVNIERKFYGRFNGVATSGIRSQAFSSSLRRHVALTLYLRQYDLSKYIWRFSGHVISKSIQYILQTKQGKDQHESYCRQRITNQFP